MHINIFKPGIILFFPIYPFYPSVPYIIYKILCKFNHAYEKHISMHFVEKGLDAINFGSAISFTMPIIIPSIYTIPINCPHFPISGFIRDRKPWKNSK